MPEVLLDSSTYIDLQRASRNRREQWAKNSLQHALEYRVAQGRPNLSVVTVVEILKGVLRDVDSAKANRFKQVLAPSFQVLAVTTEIGYLSAEIIAKLEDSREPTGFPDSLIGATAIHHGLVLVTSNTRHFERVSNLGFPILIRNWRGE